jgi:hypothetical protein
MAARAAPRRPEANCRKHTLNGFGHSMETARLCKPSLRLDIIEL